MPTLRNLQADMAAAVRGLGEVSSSRLLAAVGDDGLAGARRLNIYRNNVAHGLVAALTATYPIVERLVGGDFFAHAARDFARARPPAPGPLLDWGGAFADFLDAYEPARTLAYLGDVARLEWSCHEAFHAADAPALDPGALAVVPPDRLGDIVFALHPATRILGSRWPVFSIWQLHGADADPDATLDLDAGGEGVLITRPGRAVSLGRLSLSDFTFLSHLHRGETVGAACVAAMQADGDFDPTRVLALCLKNGAFQDFYIREKE